MGLDNDVKTGAEPTVVAKLLLPLQQLQEEEGGEEGGEEEGGISAYSTVDLLGLLQRLLQYKVLYTLCTPYTPYPALHTIPCTAHHTLH
jgi:hypothetical protein